MAAGESARAKARSLREQADRLRDEAARWDAGAAGEERVAAALAGADPHSSRVLHDRLLAAGRSEANLDHLFVCRAGVFLIDAKNWIGAVTVYNESLWQHFTTPDGRRSENKKDELDKVRRMAAQAHAVSGCAVTPVLCLAGDQPRQLAEPAVVRGVQVVPIGGLLDWLQAQPAVMSPDDVATKAVDLSCAFPPAVNPGLTMPALAADAQPDTTHARPAPRARRRSAPRRGSPVRSRRNSTRSVVGLLAVVLVMLFLPKIAAIFGAQVSRIVTAAAAPPPATPTLPSDKLQALDDWRIRAGLYGAHVQPSSLPYVTDANLGTQSDACRKQQTTLARYRTGLLGAPDAKLAEAAQRYDTASQALLAACVRDDAVALHHARTAVGVAAADVNTRYNVLLGKDPRSYAATRVL